MNISDTVRGEKLEVIDERPFAPWDVTIDIHRVNSLIGKAIGEDTIETILHALEIEIKSKEANIWKLAVPRYRVDVQRECDVVEDILRIYGYDNVEFPEKLNTSLAYGQKPDPVALQRRIAEQLTAQGFNEILNNSLTKMAYYEPLKELTLDTCVKIMNPLSQDLGVLRQTLLFGGLESIARNANRRNSDLRFYEFGNCYHYDKLKAESLKLKEVGEFKVESNPLIAYSEEPHLGLWITGNKTAQSWVRREEKTSFYQLRAYVNNI